MRVSNPAWSASVERAPGCSEGLGRFLQRHPGFGIAPLHALARTGGIQPGDDGFEHQLGSGVEVDRGGHWQHGRVVLQPLQGGAAQPQPAKLVQTLGQQRGIGRDLACSLCCGLRCSTLPAGRHRLRPALQQQLQLGLRQIQAGKQAGPGRHRGRCRFAVFEQRSEVQPRLRIDDLPRQENLRIALAPLAVL